MIPFRPTEERIWDAVRSLRVDWRKEKGYVIHMGPDLWYDTMRDPRIAWLSNQVPGFNSIFGLPFKVDHTMPRGWVSLRHEVVR